VTKNGVDTLEVHLPMCVFPKWKNHGLPSHVKTLLPDHPLAKGVPPAFDLPQTEMYADPFHVPPPDISVFEERWDAGETFRSGSVWQVGKGRVFYFRPGHETYPIFKQEAPQRILVNAVQWLGKK
jgi:trehalose utilization protein